MQAIPFLKSKSGQKFVTPATPTICTSPADFENAQGQPQRALAKSSQRWFGALGAMVFGELWSCKDWSAWWAETAVRVVRQGIEHIVRQESEHCASKEYCGPFEMIAEVAKYFAGPVWASSPYFVAINWAGASSAHKPTVGLSRPSW